MCSKKKNKIKEEERESDIKRGKEREEEEADRESGIKRGEDRVREREREV